MSKRRARSVSKNQKTQLMALEPRVLLDGALIATAVEHSESVDLSPEIAEPLSESAQSFIADLGTSEGAESGSGATTEIVFVDDALLADESFSSALASLQDSKPGLTIVSLGKHGVDTITNTLSGYADAGVTIDAVHIFSHSQNGQLGLGGDELTTQSLSGDSAFAQSVSSWRSALGENADILLYGCNLTEGLDGVELVDRIGELTGADIASSDDLTGAEDEGGDWVLESTAGDIDASTLQLSGFSGTLADAVAVAQTSYIPLSETDIRNTLNAVTTVSGDIETVIGITVTANNTVIVYDHWEDGYETDIKNPTQSTTQIWGDGDLTNGVAPGDADDLLVVGQSLVLQNGIDPDNPAALLAGSFAYNGRDKIGSTKAVTVTRASWADNPGTVLAGAVNVIDSTTLGKVYTLPIGQNVTTNDLFEFTTLHIIATEDNTSINIDKDGDGTTDLTFTLNEGETYHVNGGMNAGGKVTADKNIGAYLIAGDAGSRFENRWFALTPDGTWSNSYYAPVATVSANDAVQVFLYNPSTTSAITVTYDTLNEKGLTVSVPANGVKAVQMPASAAHFYTTGLERFYALSTHDSGASGNTDFDWSYTLVPQQFLTDKLVLAWAPGNSLADPTQAENGSPLWVTAAADTTLQIDFNSDGTVDQTYNIKALESYRIFDTTDNDQSGMTVQTSDGTLISAAWGQDPTAARAGTPYFDLGYTVIPLPDYVFTKTGKEATTNSNGNGEIELSEEIEYSLSIYGRSVTDLFTPRVTDLLSPTAGASYVAGSARLTVIDADGTTKLIDNMVIPDIAGGGFGGFPLLSDGNAATTTDGYTIADTNTTLAGVQGLSLNQEIIITYRVLVTSDGNDLVSTNNVINNQAELDGGDVTNKTSSSNTPVVVVRDDGLVKLTDSAFADAVSFTEGNTIYIQVDDKDPNTNISAADSLTVEVKNTTTNETESVLLTETGNNTGIFRGSVATSTSVAENSNNSGTLQMAGGNSVQVSYTDPTSGGLIDSPSNYDNNTANGALVGNANVDTAAISVDSDTKILYLSDDGTAGDASGDLDRVDPSPAHTGTTDNSTQTSQALAPVTTTISDDFESNTFTGGTGWSGGWTENIIASDGQAPFSQLAIHTATVAGNPNAHTAEGTIGSHSMKLGGHASATYDHTVTVERSFASALASEATLSFAYQNWGMGINDDIKVEYFNGTAWVEIAHLDAIQSDGSTQIADKTRDDFSAFTTFPTSSSSLAENDGDDVGTITVIGTTPTKIPAGATKIRFHYDASYAKADSIYIDSVQIQLATPSDPVVYTQAIAMATDFALPSSGQVKIVTHVSNTTGLVNGNSYSGIDAALTYENGGSTNIVSDMGDAVYDSAAGTLTWTAVLGSTVTIPDGATVKLSIVNGHAATSFTIDYDSATDPSRIELPTTTVIDIVDVDNTGTVQEIGFYNNSFANSGTQIDPSLAFAGETVYVRVRVSDPFGDADISKLDLVGNGPGTAGDFSTTLTNSHVVNSAGDGDAFKTYEFAWNTVFTVGDYTITATAHEGFEGTITDAASDTFTISATDLGTPSILQFISALGGAVSGINYSAGDQAFVRLTDLDENENSTTVETVIVTVNGSTFTLTETGADTGRFEAALTGTATGIADFANLAQGNLLLASYVDNDNSLDTSSDQISVATPGNNAPDAKDNSKTTIANETVTGNAITDDSGSGTDSDPDGNGLTVVGINGNNSAIGTAFTLPSGAKVTMAANGAYTYDPNGVFNFLSGSNGSDSFTYLITDGNGATDTATVNITINPWNRPSIQVNAGVSPGTITVDETDFTTDATVDFSTKFNTIVDYGADGQGGGGVTSTYELSVSSASVDSGLDDVQTGENVLLRMNGTTLEGFTQTSNDVVFTVTVNASGSVVLDQRRGVIHSDTGNPDDSVTLSSTDLVRLKRTDVITDATGDTATSNATLNMGQTLTFKDQGPTVVVDTNTVAEAATAITGNVISNDTIGDSATTVTAASLVGGATLTVGTETTNASGSKITINADGSYSYTAPVHNDVPPAGLTEVFNYTLTDKDGDTASTTLTITVSDSNRQPVAVADTNTAAEAGSAINGNVITNDTVLGDTPTTVTGGSLVGGDTLTIGTEKTNASGSKITLNADGTYTYTPPPHNNVPPAGLVEVFNYTITDTDGSDASQSTLTITVSDTDRQPSAVVDTNTAAEAGSAVTGNVISNDNQGDSPTTVTSASLNGGGALTIGTELSNASGSKITLNSDGSYTYTPPPHDNVSAAGLTEVFSYTITDADGDTSSATLTLTVSDTDRLPVAVVDTGNAVEGNSAVTGNILTNDTLGDTPTTVTAASMVGGATLTIAAETTNASGSKITINADGSYTYTPPPLGNVPSAGFSEVFNYTITDNDGDVSSATLTIAVSDSDQTPVAVVDTNTAAEAGSAVTGNILTNDTAGNAPTTVTAASLVGGGALTIATEATNASGSKITINADGSYSYTPPGHNNVPVGGLTEVFNYTISDDDGDTSAATLTITVSDTDRTPVAVVDTNTAAEAGSAVTGNILSNDTAGDAPTTVTGASLVGGAALTIATETTNASGSKITINADGSYSYTPPGHNNVPVGGLTEVFNYTITDADGDTAASTLTLTVSDTDRAPVAVVDTDTAVEAGVDVTGNILTNDTAGDAPTTVTAASLVGGGALTIATEATNASGSKITINADGSYTYKPPGINNVPVGGLTEVFNYTITDADGDTSASTLTIAIADGDLLPVAVVDSNNAAEAGAAVSGNVLTNDTAGDAPTTVTGASLVGGGTLTIASETTNASGSKITVNADGSYTYTPPGHNDVPVGGLTEVFNYTITDSDGDTSAATLTITVSDTDRAPVAVVDTQNATEAAAAVTGSVVTNDTLGDTPTPVTSASINGGAALTLGTETTTGSGSKITINADGSYSYTAPAQGSVPVAGLTEVFNYTITDADGDTSSSTLTITVGDNDLAPVAVVDTASAAEAAAPITGNVITNDSLGDTPTALSAASINGGAALTLGTETTTASGSKITINADGTYTYTPPSSGQVPASGLSEVFNYTIRDTDGDISNATLTVTVSDTNLLPTAQADSANALEGGGSVSDNVFGNDTEGDGPALVSAVVDSNNNVISVGSPTTTANGGVLTLNADGSYEYSPPSQGDVPVSGLTEQFSYTLTDADGDTASATLSIVVENNNLIPRGVSDTNSGAEGGAAISGSVLGNDDIGDGPTVVTAASDSAGNPLTLNVPFTTAAGGSIVLNAQGSYTYTPPGNGLVPEAGLTEVFNYTLRDSDGDIGNSSLTITITNTNLLPVAAVDTNTALEGQTEVIGNVIANDAQGDGPALVTAVQNSTGAPVPFGTAFTTTAGGSIVFNADGSYSYTPPALGTVPEAGLVEEFTYTISDVTGDVSTSKLQINVIDVDRLPSAVADIRNLEEGAVASNGNVIGNDNQGDGPALVTSVTSATGASVALGTPFVTANGGQIIANADGTYVYTPPPLGRVPQAGLSEVFSYTITDADGDISTTTVTFVVINTPDPVILPDPSASNPPAPPPVVVAPPTAEVDPPTSPTTVVQNSNVIQQETQTDNVVQNAIRLTIQVQDRVISEGVQSFALPENAFEHSTPGEELEVRATLSDGTALPDDVIQFDAGNGSFTINADVARARNLTGLDIRIVAADSRGNEASTVFRILFTEEEEEELLLEDLENIEDAPPAEEDGTEPDGPFSPAPPEPSEVVIDDPVALLDVMEIEAALAELELKQQESSERDGNGKASLNQQVKLASRMGFQQESNQLLTDLLKLFDSAA